MGCELLESDMYRVVGREGGLDSKEMLPAELNMRAGDVDWVGHSNPRLVIVCISALTRPYLRIADY
jgi:hypothetical protein